MDPKITHDKALFAEIYPALRRFASAIADADMDPDDLVQEALVAVLDKSKLDELDNPVAYLKKIMIRSVSSQRRRFAIRRALSPKISTNNVQSDFYPSELSILDILNPQDKAILYLSSVEKFSFARIASDLGLKEPSVRKRASRARQQLLQNIRQWESQ